MFLLRKAFEELGILVGKTDPSMLVVVYYFKHRRLFDVFADRRNRNLVVFGAHLVGQEDLVRDQGYLSILLAGFSSESC